MAHVSELRELFDAGWYSETYSVDLNNKFDSLFEHYCRVGQAAGLSPGPLFDEAAYRRVYPDVMWAIEKGTLDSGHHHYACFGKAEGRQPTFHVEPPNVEPQPPRFSALGSAVNLAAKVARRLPPKQKSAAKRLYGRFQAITHTDWLPVAHPGLTDPVEFKVVNDLQWGLNPIPCHLIDAGPVQINVLLPRLQRELVFGGYIAVLHFIHRLLDRGWRVRILITEDDLLTPERVRNSFAGHFAEDIVKRTDIRNVAARTESLAITPNDRFIGYSIWSAFHAGQLSAAVGRKHLHFIQEFEPVFHAHDSMHAVSASLYRRPHFALFNSEMLRRHFASEGLGVYQDGASAGDRASAVFQHALAIPRPPTEAELEHEGPRKLVVYARPEHHAARNLFAVALMGLRAAVRNGVFEGEWEFHGIGSLKTTTDLDLGGGHVLKMKSRTGLGSYVESLRGYDVGLSLQYAPHPGVVHYELAASGIMTVTNTFSNRSAEDLIAISANLVPVEASIEGIAAGLEQAAQQAKNLPARVEGAARPWVTSWAESFNDEVMERVEDFLNE